MNNENVNSVTICLNKDLLKNYDLMEEIKAEIIKKIIKDDSTLTNDSTVTNDNINIKNWIFLDKEDNKENKENKEV